MSTKLVAQRSNYGRGRDGYSVEHRRRGIGTYHMYANYGRVGAGIIKAPPGIVVQYAFDKQKRLLDLICSTARF